MAQSMNRNKSSAQITDNPSPKLNAAISEFEKLREKHQLFTRVSSQTTGKINEKIAFQEFGDELISCLGVMRRLMEDAENENKKLKQEKFLISTKIGTALGAVNRDVEQLRAELQKQDRRLGALHIKGEMKDISNERNSDDYELRRVLAEKAEIQAKYDALNVCFQELLVKSENVERLNEQVRSYKDDIARAHETINCINNERRRLKSEKHDLLGQLREAYCIIEDKESELRDFITSYEARMRESERQFEDITNERLSWMEEKKLLHSTQPNQISQLKQVLDNKDIEVKVLQTELSEVKDQLTRLQLTLNCPVSKSDNHKTNRSNAATTAHDSGILSHVESTTRREGM